MKDNNQMQERGSPCMGVTRMWCFGPGDEECWNSSSKLCSNGGCTLPLDGEDPSPGMYTNISFETWGTN